MARDVSALADHLGLKSFDFIGYSMGGIIGLQLGSLSPAFAASSFPASAKA